MARLNSQPVIKADTAITGGTCKLRSITIAYKGVTAGDFVTLIDGASIEGTDKWVFVAPAANGTFEKTWPNPGKEFGTGLFVNVNKSGGDFFIAVET